MTGSSTHQAGPSHRLPRTGRGVDERWGALPRPCGSAVRRHLAFRRTPARRVQGPAWTEGRATPPSSQPPGVPWDPTSHGGWDLKTCPHLLPVSAQPLPPLARWLPPLPTPATSGVTGGKETAGTSLARGPAGAWTRGAWRPARSSRVHALRPCRGGDHPDRATVASHAGRDGGL